MDQLQVGIVVSRKVGKAVIRNKVKRRVKSFLRNANVILSGYRIVIIARKSAAEAGWDEMKRDLTSFFEKEILKNKPRDIIVNSATADVNRQ